MLIIIVAMDENKGIGKDGQLPWHIKDDMRLFKQNTMGHKLVMGRKTYEGLPGKLVGRQMYICGKKLENQDDEIMIDDLEAFLKLHQDDEEIYFIGGGATIYQQAYPYCQKAYISFVKGEYEVDTYFEAFNDDDWSITKEEEYDQFTYRELERK